MNDLFDEDAKEEILDLLNDCETAMLSIEKGFQQSDYESLMRNMHSLKGAFGMLGSAVLQEAFHLCESHLVKTDKTNFDSHVSEKVFLLIDESRLIAEGTKDQLSETLLHLLERQGPESLNTNTSRSEQKMIRTEVKAKTQTPTDHSLESPQNKRMPSRVYEFKDLKVYALDDEPDALAVLADILELKGCSTRTFSSGAQLKQAITESPPDVVISDFWMGDENGIDILESIYSFIPSIACILITGYADDSQLYNRAMGAGAVGLLGKPFEIYDLETMLLRAQDKKNVFKSLLETTTCLESLYKTLNNHDQFVDEDLKKKIISSLRASSKIISSRHFTVINRQTQD